MPKRQLAGDLTVKGKCHGIFVLRFFHESYSPRLFIPFSVISSLPATNLSLVINDVDSKFDTGVNDAGNNLGVVIMATDGQQIQKYQTASLT
jgi:hypothetical protein